MNTSSAAKGPIDKRLGFKLRDLTDRVVRLEHRRVAVAGGGATVPGYRGAAIATSALHNLYLTYDLHSVGEAVLTGAGLTGRPFYTVSTLTALAGTELEMFMFGGPGPAQYSFAQMSIEKIGDAGGAPLPAWSSGSDGVRPWVAANQVNGTSSEFGVPTLANAYIDSAHYTRPGVNRIGITNSGVYVVTCAHKWVS